MPLLKDLYTLVDDSTIGPDAWGDYFLDEAIALVEQIKNTEGLQDCLHSLNNLQETSKCRLLQAVTSVETIEIFPDLINLLKDATPELAEVIVDNLRHWKLNDEERRELIKTTKPFRGRWSVLLDQILDGGKF